MTSQRGSRTDESGKIVDVEPLHDLSLICMRGEHMLRPSAIGSRGTIDGFSLVVCNENQARQEERTICQKGVSRILLERLVFLPLSKK
jgi:hypothetical protein